MSEINFNKIIAKTAFITLGCLLALFVFVLSLLTLFYPVSLARLSSSLGLNDLSIYYYELSYNKTEDVNDLYNLLNKTITVKAEQKIIDNFELLYDDGNGDYYNFVTYINEFNLSSIANANLEMYLVNEDARLKSRYVTALFRLNQKQKALEFAFDDFFAESINSIDDYNKINFISSAYVQELLAEDANLAEYAVFNEYNSGEFVSFEFFDNCLNYYNNIKNIYNLAYSDTASAEEALKLKVFANNLIKIANTILVLNNKLEKAINTAEISADIQTFVSNIDTLSN